MRLSYPVRHRADDICTYDDAQALKYKEDAGWGQDDEVGFGMHGSGGSGWTDDTMFG